jgi:hypothetical protein
LAAAVRPPACTVTQHRPGKGSSLLARATPDPRALADPDNDLAGLAATGPAA